MRGKASVHGENFAHLDVHSYLAYGRPTNHGKVVKLSFYFA